MKTSNAIAVLSGIVSRKRLMKNNILYRAGFKYKMAHEYSVLTGIKPEVGIHTEYWSIDATGLVTARVGYCWDGATKALDSVSFMRGALIHDIGCQAIMEGHLSRARYKEAVDRELIKICAEDGMVKIRQWWVWRAVKKFSCTDPDAHKLMSAPDIRFAKRFV
jgi:hypothetical protein